MRRVLIVCPYPHGRAPSQRFRFEQYLDLEGVAFRQESFWKEDEWPEIYKDGSIKYKVLRTIAGFWRRLLLLGQVRKFDKVFIHREATPIGPPWFEWAVVKLFRKPLIFDFDDAIWLPNSSKANEKLAGKLKFHGKTAKICSWATTCSVGNAFLADYARQYCDDVRVIPTTIDTEGHHNPDLYVRVGSKWVKKTETVSVDKEGDEEPLAASHWPLADHLDSDNLDADKENVKMPKDGQKYTESSPTEKQLIGTPEKIPQNSGTADSQQLKANSNPVGPNRSSSPNTQYSIPNTTVGWTGTHSTLKQLTPLFPLLEELHHEIPFNFLLIADIPPDTMPDFVEFRKWKKETEIEDLLEMDIGIMPLYDTDWERGKCGFKALQYQALRIPAIVSSVGVNMEIVQNGITGYCCESFPLGKAKQWKTALNTLLQNPEQRKQMGHAARQHVEEHYSVRSQEAAFRKIFF